MKNISSTITTKKGRRRRRRRKKVPLVFRHVREREYTHRQHQQRFLP